MPETLPRLEISDAQPLDTKVLRDHPVFQTADPTGEVPDVLLGSAPLNPSDRPHRAATRVGISDTDGNAVGALNLVQKSERSWVNDIRIEAGRQGERLAVASYIGVIVALHEVGRGLESDPGGLSPDSTKVWESLTRRGVAQVVEGARDQHGHPRFVAPAPTAEQPNL